MTCAPQASREDVLDAFAVEPDPGRETLERYLRSYPEYAVALVDLSRELSRSVCEDEGPLSKEDQLKIEAAWQQHVAAAPETVTDPLVGLSTAEQREIASKLQVPRQVISAFRERRVILDSVPRRFLSQLAAATNRTIDLLADALSAPSVPGLVRSYRADSKPSGGAPVTFEQLLIDAGLSNDERAKLMAEEE